jgi:protein-tyrosine phosphatase
MKVLIVCLGNICRSPMGEGIWKKVANDLDLHIEVDSAGTQGFHTGEAPDRRAINCMEKHGIPIGHLKARKLVLSDFDAFDCILTMDQQNYRDAMAIAKTDAQRAKMAMVRAMDEEDVNGDVPDPYFGNQEDFEVVYQMCHKAATAWCLAQKVNG